MPSTFIRCAYVCLNPLNPILDHIVKTYVHLQLTVAVNRRTRVPVLPTCPVHTYKR